MHSYEHAIGIHVLMMNMNMFVGMMFKCNHMFA